MDSYFFKIADLDDELYLALIEFIYGEVVGSVPDH